MAVKKEKVKGKLGINDFQIVKGYIFPKSDDLFTIKKYIDYSDVDSLLKKIRNIIDDDQVIIQHPLSGVKTKACYSLPVLPNANAVFFVSHDNREWWVALQINNFIDAIIVEDKIFLFAKKSNERLVLNQANKLLDTYDFGSLDTYDFLSMNLKFEGFALGIPRPFHSFYDHLMYLAPLERLGLLKGRRLALYNDVFFAAGDLLPNIGVVEYDPGEGVYLNLSFVRALSLQGNKLKEFNKIAREFEGSVLEACVKKSLSARGKKRNLGYFPEGVPGKSRLGLWIGITGQKRSWMQQVEGYSEIINKIKPYFDDLVVFLDGMTSPVGRVVKSEEDSEVCDLIKSAFEGRDDICFVDMVGMTYEKKITLCHDCVDFFISNAGTGAVVPLRFCNKPGVMHSNSSLYSFPGEYGERVKLVAGDEVLDDVRGVGISPDRVSYYASWELIYNKLADLISSSPSFDVKIDKMDQVSLYGNLGEDGVDVALKVLDNSLEKSKNGADSLRELALFFEIIGDYGMAYKVMALAKKARPNGPFIRRKVDEYKSKLELLDES